ncbi:MAG: 3-deoxy-manno-octulosonate cytidylyltransferase [Nitrospinae bacterium]|nr:3-deoxy-manno-octulosonate cytidylyltransferase [Nitrospinota bacterium]
MERRAGDERAAAVIPARFGSTRFPGKPLVDVAGRPLIAHVVERCREAELVGRIIVATDDERIMGAAEASGAEAVMTNPSHPSGTDRVAEVAAGLSSELIVNVQGDEPIIAPDAIDAAIAPLLGDPTIPISTLMVRLTEPSELFNPNVTKVVIDRHGFALYFSRWPIPYIRQAWPNIFEEGRERASEWVDAFPWYKHVGLYVYRREVLLELAELEPTALEEAEGLEQLRALAHGYTIKVVETEHDSIGVDTPEDVALVEAILAHRHGAGRQG